MDTKKTKEMREVEVIEAARKDYSRNEIAIEVKDLHIVYRILKSFSIKKSLLHLKKAETETFEALRGVTFDVHKGEILGIIGKNGSGKSTLLRAIAGIFSADEGSIDLHGNSISLLSIGVGFIKRLTGRENIMLSGMLLGFSEETVRSKMDEIISFAGLGKFIDLPVKTYSSGMYSKLAFSITAILEADIILIDEILSVGDAKFRKKSYGKMKELISNEDRTVVIVSHNNDQIRELCSKVLWLNDGVIEMIGEPDAVLHAYDEYMSK